MGLNTQFPSWLQDQQQLNAQVGMQLGRNFMEGMKMAEDKRLNEAKMAEMRRMNDIQIQQAQAQIAREKAATEAQVNLNNYSALTAQGEADLAGKMADFAAMQQNLYKLDGGLSNPDAQVQALEFVRNNPKVAYTRQWAELSKDLDTARGANDKLKQIKEAGTFRIQAQEAATKGKIDVANIMADARTQAAKLGRGLTPEELMQQGLPREEAVKVSQRLIEEKSPSGKAKWAVEDIAEGLKSNGVEFTDAEKSAARGSYGQSGVSLRAGPKLKENIMSESVSVEMLDGIQDRINKYEQDYGIGSFNKTVGPVQNALRNLERYTTDPNSMSEQQREANSIFQSVNQLIQGYRKGNFGTALTENETKVFNGIVSQPNFSDYTERLNDFRNQISDKVGIEVRQLKFAPDIPMDVKVRFLKKGDTYVSPAQPATITGGKKVTVTAVPPGSRISPQQFQYPSSQQSQGTNQFTSGKYQIQILGGQ